VLLAADKVHLT